MPAVEGHERCCHAGEMVSGSARGDLRGDVLGAAAGGVGVVPVELGDTVGRGLLGAVDADCDVRGVNAMGWRVVCRLMAQFRSAAAAALTLPICGSG